MSNQLMNRNPAPSRFLPPKPAKPVPAPVVRNPAVDEIIQLAGRLVALMEQETGLLEKMQVAAIAEGQVEKERLARQFETKLRALAVDKKAVAAVAPVIRAEFAEAMDKFRAVMRANERSLRAAKDANERVVKAIVEAAQAQSAPSHAYSAAGTMGAPVRYDRAAPAPVTLNRTL